jgi:hypothetical protein
MEQVDYSLKTKEELITLCKENNVKGYSGKKKDELVALLQSSNKKSMGQFYTTNSSYILEGFSLPPDDIRCILEPFAGKGDLIEWVRKSGYGGYIEAYDIEPKNIGIQKRDTLKNPADYSNTWIITNPPYLARNKSEDKDIYELYNINVL